ncbi:putative phage recombinase [Vibrio astriarenae]|nr:putative phage recombinase [Vibrio sp. C7]
MQGFGATKIAGILNAEGVPTWDNKRKVKPKKWYNKFILDNLASDALIGTAHFKVHDGTVTLKDHYPRIITDEQYAYIQSQIQNRKQTKSVNVGSSKSTSFVTGVGITYCAYCGSAMIAKQMKRKLNDGSVKFDKFMACSGAQQQYTKCTTARSLLRVLERCVVEFCYDRLNFKTVFDQSTPRDELKELIAKRQAELDTLDKQRKRLVKLYSMMEDDEDDTEVSDQITENRQSARLLSDELEEMNKELVSVRDSIGDEFVELVAQVRDGTINEATRLRLREIVPMFIERIDIANRGFSWCHEDKRKERLDRALEVMGDDVDWDVIEQLSQNMSYTGLKRVSYCITFKSGERRFFGVDRKSGDWEVQVDF